MTTLDKLATALADRYRVMRSIGTGGMTSVYIAERDPLSAVLMLRGVLGAELRKQPEHPDLLKRLGWDRSLPVASR